MVTVFDFGAVRLANRTARKFAFSLLIALPILALCLAHSFATSSASSLASPEFGYADWAVK